MHKLAKLGFTQSYTYFTWRNTRYELTEYFTELSQHESREYFRPNVWPNTPDISMNTCSSAVDPPSSYAPCWQPPWRRTMGCTAGLRADGAHAERAWE